MEEGKKERKKESEGCGGGDRSEVRNWSEARKTVKPSYTVTGNGGEGGL